MVVQRDVDGLVNDLVMSEDTTTKQNITRDIFEIARSRGIYLASIHDLYLAQARHRKPFTVPAMNLRSLTYYLARAIFRVARRHQAGAFIFEIAKSEMGYTNQPPVEYTGVVLAAAIKEGYQGPVFIQGDHCQIKAKAYFENPSKEVGALKSLIDDCVAAGFYNIDIDSSTIVDLKKKTIKEQQGDNYRVCAELTQFIREIQPQGIQVSVGGEIGEVGGKNSTIEELEAFMQGYQESLASGSVGISKISIQTGTSHGGVVLPDGSIKEVSVDFETLKKLSAHARDVYKIGGAVQHGASTLPQEAFHKFPEIGTVEIHLATNFQNMIFESNLLPEPLRKKMYQWVEENCTDEKKEGQSQQQFIYKARKKVLGPFKKELMSLPANIKEGIAKEIEENFDFLFRQLNVVNTQDFVNSVIKPVEVELGLGRKAKAVLDGEGDD